MDKWDIDFAVIGTTTDDRKLRLEMYGHEWCNIPVPPLVDEAPKYIRPHEPTPAQATTDQNQYSFETTGFTPVTALKKLMSGPQLSSKRWIWEQYDTMVRGQTIKRPAQSDAAIIGLPDSPKALAISSDCNPRYCFADPLEGGKQAVTESWRNIVASGAKPLAITDNMNFGNPERPEIMGQFVGCIEGMREACEALSYPVISGNVSLYNETNGKAILPTPVIGGVGLLQDRRKALGLALKNSGETLYMIGENHKGGHLDQSLYASELCNLEQGPPPKVDLQSELKNGHFILAANEAGLISACHDIAHGGLLSALTKMAMASLEDPYDPSLAPLSKADTSIGFTLDEALPLTAGFLFGEDQGRYIIASSQGETLENLAQEHGVTITRIGKTQAQVINLASETVNVCDLKHLNETALPDYMKHA
jgi:phosphoribosylformylglycinamidine synthase